MVEQSRTIIIAFARLVDAPLLRGRFAVLRGCTVRVGVAPPKREAACRLTLGQALGTVASAMTRAAQTEMVRAAMSTLGTALGQLAGALVDGRVAPRRKHKSTLTRDNRHRNSFLCDKVAYEHA